MRCRTAGRVRVQNVCKSFHSRALAGARCILGSLKSETTRGGCRVIEASRADGGGRSSPGRVRYRLPVEPQRYELQDLIRSTGRTVVNDKQFDLLRSYGTRDAFIHCAGDVSLLSRKAVSIVGTRDVSEEGWRRASRLARELSEAGILVVSGLARGVDTAALSSAIKVGGKTAAVIGTPLQKAYPNENSAMQADIAQHHLLVSPFAEGEAVYKSNFPKRNRVMALLSDATVIVEASDTSGTLHQAAECLKQGRWLFILRSVLDDTAVTWPARFLKDERTVVLTSSNDILSRI
ncbi:DNA-processing protein DprA [Methylobacterium sp. JK268]